MINRICIDCGRTYGKSGSEKNGGHTEGMCLDCFIRWLEGKIKWLEKMNELYPTSVKFSSRFVRVKFLKELLVKKLINRQEGREE